jgi:DNA repair protein RecO (recombination protein O)
MVHAEWRARLDEHLGTFKLDLSHSISSLHFDDPLALSALSLICSHLGLFPERDPHPRLYDGACFLLKSMEDADVWPGLLARFEMEVLGELGYQLDLTACAATGGNDNLIYVSPKSGRAVSASAGEPYKDKLLPLPAFLSGAGASAVTEDDLFNAYRLTGAFFDKHIYPQREGGERDVRLRFLGLFNRQMM